MSFGALPCKKKKLMTARVLMLKSRASLTCFRGCFLPGRAKDLSAPRYSDMHLQPRNGKCLLYQFYFGGGDTSIPPAQWARASLFTRFLDHTQRRTPVGSTPLDESLARRRDLYLTIHNIHNRQTSMPSVGIERTISGGERSQTYSLDWDRPCSSNFKNMYTIFFSLT